MTTASLQHIIPDHNSSFRVRLFEDRYFDSPLHYHTLFELLVVLDGDGLCYCGDHISPFAAGDVLLFAPSLPHVLMRDRQHTKTGLAYSCRALCIQFAEETLPAAYRTMPELSAVARLLHDAARGLRFRSNASSTLVPKIERMIDKAHFDRLLDLYDTLQILAADSLAEPLASVGYQAFEIRNHEQLGRVIEYMRAHFSEPLTLDTLASTAGMNRSAFCRFFKRSTGLTPLAFVREIRLFHTTRELTTTDQTISEVAYTCGFNNIAHFIELFKRKCGYTPSNYRKLFR